MCGVVAVVRPGASSACPGLSKNVEVLRHRGPDKSGHTSVRLPWGRVDLGMSRLKIVDQQDLTVPYVFAWAGVVLGFNGEIYNWQELRVELDSRVDGRWETTCDAEVVAWAWRVWGPQMLKRFNGMFALVVVDTAEGEVFVARDRAGQKPLYYCQNDGALAFASEAKALPIQLEAETTLDVEAFEFDWGHAVPLRGVCRLEAGTSWHITHETFRDSAWTQHRPKQWWTPPRLARAGLRDASLYRETVRDLTELIVDAVRLRLSDEVGVALQLSGGLDSAIIYKAWESFDPDGASNALKVCMDFTTDGIDNLSRAEAVTSGVVSVGLNVEEVEEILPNVLYHLDTPATWSALCLWKLAKAIHESGSKIILSGEGADELFGGYTRYRVLWWLDMMRHDKYLEAYEPTISHVMGDQWGVLARMLNRGCPDGLTHEHVLDIIAEKVGSFRGSLVRQAMLTEFGTTMQVLLRMGDRMASAWGLENRCPFLDYRIIHLASELPDAWLVRSEGSKVILRDVARELGVFESIVNETTKRGLAIPWARWAPALCPSRGSKDSSRGVWDRSGFADLSNRVWRSVIPRAPICADGCNRCSNVSSTPE